MEKKFRRTGLSFKTKNHFHAGLVFNKRNVKIIPIIKNGNVQFDIKIRAKAAITELENPVSTAKLSLEAKKIIKKEIMKTYQKGLEIDSDVYRLSHVLYEREFPIWKKNQLDGKIPLTMDSIRNVDVQVMIQDGGKQRKIPTLK